MVFFAREKDTTVNQRHTRKKMPICQNGRVLAKWLWFSWYRLNRADPATTVNIRKIRPDACNQSAYMALPMALTNVLPPTKIAPRSRSFLTPEPAFLAATVILAADVTALWTGLLVEISGILAIVARFFLLAGQNAPFRVEKSPIPGNNQTAQPLNASYFSAEEIREYPAQEVDEGTRRRHQHHSFRVRRYSPGDCQDQGRRL